MRSPWTDLVRRTFYYVYDAPHWATLLGLQLEIRLPHAALLIYILHTLLHSSTHSTTIDIVIVVVVAVGCGRSWVSLSSQAALSSPAYIATHLI